MGVLTGAVMKTIGKVDWRFGLETLCPVPKELKQKDPQVTLVSWSEQLEQREVLY